MRFKNFWRINISSVKSVFSFDKMSHSIYSILAYPDYYPEEFKEYSELYPKVWGILMPKHNKDETEIAAHAIELAENEKLLQVRETYAFIITVFESDLNKIKDYYAQNNQRVLIGQFPYKELQRYARCPGA